MALRNVTEEEKALITKVFYTCDQDDKGFLNQEDLKAAMLSSFGYKPSKYEVKEMMTKAGTDQSQKDEMRIEKFTELMTSKMAAQDEDELIRQSFLTFDSQCRGFLTVEDLRKVFSQVAPHMSDHMVESAFREIDRDGDGRVSYKDFEFMMKYSMEDHL